LQSQLALSRSQTRRPGARPTELRHEVKPAGGSRRGPPVFVGAAVFCPLYRKGKHRMIMRGCITAVAILAASCADIRHEVDYTQSKPTRVEAVIPASRSTALDVYFSPKHPSAVWVQVPTGQMVSDAWSHGNDQWMALRPEIEPIYRAAALKTLAPRGQPCELTDPTPWPDSLAFKFTFHCNPREATAQQ
jgi:hypothetical protein